MTGADVWVAGATGLVGRALVDCLLNRADVARVTAIGRRPTGRTNSKLRESIVDFEGPEDGLAGLAGLTATHVFCCLGTTIAAAGNQEAFRRVDHRYPLALGRAARNAGAQRFLVVTAMGANTHSLVFYNRVKGELERDLHALALPELHIFRPSLLLGERTERRRGERVAAALAAPISALLRGPLRRYRPIAATHVAEAMARVAFDHRTASQAVTVYPSDRIEALAKGPSPAGP